MTSFVLAGPAGTLVAEGITTAFPRVDDAHRALRDGSADLVVGALPFDVHNTPAALFAPLSATFFQTRRRPAPGELPRVRIVEAIPEPQQHRSRIESALRELNNPESPLQKVVLARALRMLADNPIDESTLLARLLAADASATGYLADLSAAGGDYAGSVFVGASPELLVARSGRRVTCQPFAGSASRSEDPAIDTANGRRLQESGKNRHEHQLVVDTMREALAPLCTELDVASEPQLSRTATLWHLSTPIQATLREPSTTAIDLALALHPTAAVGGVPQQSATELIARLEGDRGFYAGAVGWCDRTGDGRWVVAIRGAQLSADRRNVVARAGGGIVAESDPDDEVDETSTKFRTILSALGVTQ